METKKVKELLELVKRNYNEIAANFDATRKKEIWPEIRKIAADVKEGASVLDVGCGNGRLLEVFKDKKINYLGFDNSEELIKIAKNNYPTSHFLVADILNLEQVEDKKFDYVFCLAVIQHIPSRELRLEALRQMAKRLNENGNLVISTWNLWQSPKHRSLLFKNFWLKVFGKYSLDFNDLLFPWKNSGGEAISDRYYHAYTKKELKKLARLANLRIIRLDKDSHNYWLILKKKK